MTGSRASTRLSVSLKVLAGFSAAFVLLACSEIPPPEESYYSREIAPAIKFTCAQQTTGCHLARDGQAAGNLDLTSYDSLMRRRDALSAYGPYPLGLFLMKVSPPSEIAVETLDAPDPAFPEQRTVMVRTDIRHAAGAGVQVDSTVFNHLVGWINNGHTRTGAPPAPPAVEAGTDCTSGAGAAPDFDPNVDPADTTSYERFKSDVWPVMRTGCASTNCHGARLADLHLACGDTDQETRWNYFIALQHVTEPVERSEILLKPLAVLGGGTSHVGGDTFASREVAGYAAIARWASELVARNPALVREDTVTEGFRYFANRVQPTLVRKGCMFLNCHSLISPAFELRGGSHGGFSRFARRANYRLVRKFLAYESPDPNQSRVVAKNVFTADFVAEGQGLRHRGGSLFEDFGATGAAINRATPDDCASYDATNGDLNEVPAYCIMAQWHAIERREAIARGEIFEEAQPVRSVVWVARPLGIGRLDDFDAFRGGADLRIADATLGADGAIALGAPRSLLGGCGLDTTADVRGPAVSWDGTHIAFAARTSATVPLRIYEMASDGTGCARIDGLASATELENGILTHDFDPAYAPDGRLAFASTRGNLSSVSTGYSGPTRTPASLAPNANLYVFHPAERRVQQLTFLLNQELAPSFMADGRMIFTAEKREPGFHQFALRRQNIDGGDYHPLYGQRPSVGFGSAHEVTQLSNQEFAFVASPMDAVDGAGTIAFANRSIGPDQADRDPGDRAFLHSLRMPLPGAMSGTSGVFRSPTSLPGGRIIASCDLAAADLRVGPFDFDLCEIDTSTGVVRRITGEPGVAEVEATAVFARPNRGVFRSDGLGIDRPNIRPEGGDAIVHFNDFPMIASLMFANVRTGRPIDLRIGGFDVIEPLPPPTGATSFGEIPADVQTDELGQIYVSRRRVGHVDVFADGSARMQVPSGIPLIYQLTDHDGAPLQFPAGGAFEGTMIQREQEQYYPGERIQRSVPRRFFNALCGACHGSISGRELDVAVDLDVISGASINAARDSDPVNIAPPPGDRAPL